MVSWSLIPYGEQLRLHMKSDRDPVFFCEHEAFLGLKLYPVQQKVLRDFYWNHFPYGPLRELILVWGMRSSKTFMAACFACYELWKLHRFEDPAEHYGLAPGSEIFLINIATNERQARDTIFAQEKAKIDNSPWFQYVNYREIYDEFRFPDKSIVVRSGGCNSASLVGKTSKVALFDELSRFRNTQGKFSAEAVYESLGRSVETFGDEGIKILTSSILTEEDLILKQLNLAPELPSIMASKLATWEVNPNITQQTLAPEFKKDPNAAWRDFGCIPWAGGSNYFGNPEIIKLKEDLPNILEHGVLDRRASIPYTCVVAGDPALKRDGFGLGIAYHDWDTDKFVVPGIYRYEPKIGEVDPRMIRNTILDILDRLPVYEVVFDTWMFPETVQAIEERGVPVTQHIVRMPEYEMVKDLLFREHLEICNYPVVKKELRNLIIKGRRVDHAPGFSKDAADCIANAIWALTREEASEFTPRVFIPLGGRRRLL